MEAEEEVLKGGGCEEVDVVTWTDWIEIPIAA